MPSGVVFQRGSEDKGAETESDNMKTGEALALHASLSSAIGDVELLPRGRPEHPRSPATMEEEPAVQLPGQPEPAATEEDRPEEAPPLHPRVSGSDVVGGSSAEEIPAPDDDSHAPKAEAQGVLTAVPRVEGGMRQFSVRCKTT